MSTTTTTQASASSRNILAGNLSPASFSPFGTVIQNPARHNGEPKGLESVGANQGTATKWVDVTQMHDFYEQNCPSRKKARSVMNMFVCEPRRLERRREGKAMVFPVKVLERHPFTPQTFVPMGVSAGDRNVRYLVVVAPTLPSSSAANTRRASNDLPPPYPRPEAKPKRSLKDRLLGARPNPYTNSHEPSTTPVSPNESSLPTRQGPGPPDLDNIQAFIARGDQAVTYGTGTWHAPMVVLGDRPIEFVVVQYANGVGNEDCQEIEITVSDGGEGLAVDVGDVNAVKAKL